MYWELLLKDGLLAMENTQQMPDELKYKFRKLIDYGQLHQKISPN
jgi:hypothetical protein